MPPGRRKRNFREAKGQCLCNTDGIEDHKEWTMRIKLNSIFVDDQDKALRFYTEVLVSCPGTT